MKFALLLCTLTACVGVPPGKPGGNNCGIRMGGDATGHGQGTMFESQLSELVDAALDAATLTTDFRFLDQIENCQAMVGYTLFTMPTPDWQSPWYPNFRVAGLTSCVSRIIVVGTPASGDWRDGATVHELFHVMQHCDAPHPNDIGNDSDHSNWYRDGVFDAIERARTYKRESP